MKNALFLSIIVVLVLSLFSCTKGKGNIIDKIFEKNEEDEIEEIYGKDYEVIDGLTNFYLKCSSSASGASNLYPEYYEESNEFYFFLPSSVNKNELQLYYESDGPVYINGIWVKSGSVTDALYSDINTVTCGDFVYIIKILSASTSVGSIFISTKSGNLNYVLENKDNKESGNIICQDSDGNLIYDGGLKYIKGRGNYSWLTFPKNPFNIKLDKSADLTGSGKAKTFCLIANYQDDVLVKNKVLYDFSGKLGNYYQQSKFYDVYINGHYYGLYQVTDKIEVGNTRIDTTDLDKLNEEANPGINIESLSLKGNRSSASSYDCGTVKYVDIKNSPNDYSNGYILEYEIPGRYEKEISGFVSKGGQSIVLKSPEYASYEEVMYISSFYQDFEDALLSITGFNGKGRHFTDYIDIDSFAVNYLLQELTRNSDTGVTSFYLVKKDDKLYCEPVWDFDNSLYSNNDLLMYNNGVIPELFAATQEIREYRYGKDKRNVLTVLGQLYSQPVFRKHVIQLWETKVSKMIDDLILSFQKNYYKIYDSRIMNDTVWGKYNTKDYYTIESKGNIQLKKYISLCDERKSFLDNYFSSNNYSVYYFSEFGTGYVIDTKSYKKNQTLEIKTNNFYYSSKTFIGWITKKDGTGTFYNSGDKIIINSDLILYAIWV